MPRIDLLVPFAEKNEAKSLGARWDVDKKVWYVPDGLDSKTFQKWLPPEPKINIRSSSYFIAESTKSCWKCGGRTRVYGFLLPAGHETYEPVDEADAGFGPNDKFDDAVFQVWLDSPESNMWVRGEEPVMAYYITFIPETVISRIQALSSSYKISFSKTTESSYWMNHCEYCDMKQGDFQLYEEPQGAFFPLDESDAKNIKLYPVSETFECTGSYSYGASLIDYTLKM